MVGSDLKFASTCILIVVCVNGFVNVSNLNYNNAMSNIRDLSIEIL